MSLRLLSVTDRRALRAFIDLPKRIYRDTPQWVPCFDADYRAFHAGTHPFFAHAEAEFLLVLRGGDPVARVMMIRNDRYNAEHSRESAHFYFVDFFDDAEAIDLLFDAMRRWAAERGLTELIGPLFSGATFGGGILVDGFQHRAAMTMMPYHHAYYAPHFVRHGFAKHFDLNSLVVDPDKFILPERVERLAERVRERGRMKALRFSSKRELRRVANEVARLYNPTLADHHENYPLTDEELARLIDELLQIVVPDLEKIITYDDHVVGFMLAFPDLTPAIQRSGGKITPLAILRLLRLKRTTDRLILNGMGILEQYQRLGGNALIYSELARTLRDAGRYRFREAEMVQINEETDLMLADMRKLGAEPYKRHRVFRAPVAKD